MESYCTSGLYLYGIIPTGENIIFDVSGAGAEIIDVFTVPYYSPLSASPRAQGIAGVVSASPTFDFNHLTRKETKTYQARHQQVITKVMQSFPVLPVRFGTVLSSEMEVSQLLAEGNIEFRGALEKLSDRTEMEISVTWDLEAVLDEIEQQDAILFARDCLSTCSLDATAGRVQALGRLLKTSLDRRRSAIRQFILPVLHKITPDLSITCALDEHIVLQVSLLLDRNGRRELEQKLASLEKSYACLHHSGGPALAFHLDGPFPPTHFSIVDVKAIPFFPLPLAIQNGLI
jgi:Gas vesicle synthesis protein GvpL/GvpF